MKNYYYIALVTILFYNCESSCDDVTDRFINASGKNIEIVVYKNYANNIPYETYSTKHAIPNNTSLIKSEKSCLPRRIYPNIEKLFEGDSIIIDFGDRKLRYGIKNLSSLRNPYYLAIKDFDEFNFTYTLTPEDYANALP